LPATLIVRDVRPWNPLCLIVIVIGPSSSLRRGRPARVGGYLLVIIPALRHLRRVAATMFRASSCRFSLDIHAGSTFAASATMLPTIVLACAIVISILLVAQRPIALSMGSM
jgi:hypothetical protein